MPFGVPIAVAGDDASWAEVDRVAAPTYRDPVTCRDQVLAAFEVLYRQTGRVDFTANEALAQLRITGSSYKDRPFAPTSRATWSRTGRSSGVRRVGSG